MSPPFPLSRQSDNRKEPRVSVSWRARLVLPNGQPLDVRVRDISENGLGVQMHERVPEQQPLTLGISMPDVEDPSRAFMVPCLIRPVFVVLQGHDYRVGAEWLELQDAARTLVKAWIRRIQHGI